MTRRRERPRAGSEPQRKPGAPGGRISRRTLVRIAFVGSALLLALLVARVTGLTGLIGLESLDRLKNWIDGFGAIAPVVFIALYVVATVAFLPGAPLSLLAGLVFGPVWGTVWTVAGATVGATLAFFIGRYAARGLVEGWTAENERVRKLDDGVEKHGWRMLLITRLVPIFPFNLQNYAYGSTGIGGGTYVVLTALCIVPGTVVYTFAGGSLASVRDDLGRTFVYLGVAAVFFVVVSLIPGWLRRRGGA